MKDDKDIKNIDQEQQLVKNQQFTPRTPGPNQRPPGMPGLGPGQRPPGMPGPGQRPPGMPGPGFGPGRPSAQPPCTAKIYQALGRRATIIFRTLKRWGTF